MTHLDDNTVAELVQGMLDEARLHDVEAHLDACADCRSLLQEIAANLTPPTQPYELGTAAPKVGDVIAARYALERRLGAGGMGEVWAAADLQLERKVAIKLLLTSVAGDRRAHARFRHEATAIAKLDSPHIVRVHDYGIDGERPYIIMELLHGSDLSSRLRCGKMDLMEVMRIVDQVAAGLETAHRAGYVHRDLKPSNVFIQRGGQVKIVDFGLAKNRTLDQGDDGTTMGVLVGTPSYMSPEQLNDPATVDHRTDVWALAVLAYVALTGRRPFTGPGIGDLIADIITSEPPPASSWLDAPAAGLDRFFERGLAKSPSDRFASAGELASAFEALQHEVAINVSLSLAQRREPTGRFSAWITAGFVAAGASLGLWHADATTHASQAQSSQAQSSLIQSSLVQSSLAQAAQPDAEAPDPNPPAMSGPLQAHAPRNVVTTPSAIRATDVPVRSAIVKPVRRSRPRNRQRHQLKPSTPPPTPPQVALFSNPGIPD